MAIQSISIISNVVSMNYIPSVDEDAQQVLNINSNGTVTLTRYYFEHKLIERSKETFTIEHADSLLNTIVEGFKTTVPVSKNVSNNEWEMIIKSDEGYNWYNGSLDGGAMINNQTMTAYIKDYLKREDLIIFG